jgi:UDP-2-acetamido-2-deoxy-ribo-hexuluronate aminotransferase
MDNYPLSIVYYQLSIQMKNIQMVDLQTQYQHLQPIIDAQMLACLKAATFINGAAVSDFQRNLEVYLGVKHVIPCANGTDALQIAMMALGLKRGDEVIVPAFTYVATAEVIGLLGLKPVMIDVHPETFNITADLVEKAITPKTKAIVPVHLFGQSCDMESIMNLANKYNIYVIEDNAQAIGADYTFKNGTQKKTGTIGHIGCTSFFPSKNLGCYGDGGAMMTNDDALAAKLRMIANHGQKERYYHHVIGVNSRLDTLQAIVLNAKLPHLDTYNANRNRAAEHYDAAFQQLSGVKTPVREPNSNHVFHQYTLLIKENKREALQNYLKNKGIPSMIYYPVPLYKQPAFSKYVKKSFELPVTESFCREVLSLPIHTEMNDEILNYISNAVTAF